VRSARSLYRLSLAVAGLALAAIAVAIVVAARAIDFADLSLAEIASACRRVVPADVGVDDALVLALAGVSIGVAVLALHGLLRHLRCQRRTLRNLRVIGAAGGHARLIGDRRLLAFCAGYLRPRVYVSTGAVGALRPDELEAVLAHEHHHARRRDPLRVLVVEVLGDALFFLPIMRRLRRRYRALSEVAADEAALRAVGDAAPLASALVTFGDAAEAGVVGIAPERVDQLLGDPPRWEIPPAAVAAGLVTIAALFFGALGAARAAQPAELSLPLLTAEACMVAMTVMPMLIGGSLLLAVRRMVEGTPGQVNRPGSAASAPRTPASRSDGRRRRG
jgi:BlaR1 peptidase M56